MTSPALPLAAAQERLGKPGRPRKATLGEQAATAVSNGGRRLLDVRGVGEYLSVSVRIVRELRAAGVLQPVSLPRAGGRQITKLLFDRRDLDALIDCNKPGRAVR